MRRGVWLLVLGVLAAVAGAAAARAAGTVTTTTTTTTGTTTGATTTTGTTTTTPAPSYARLSPSYLPTGCVGAGAAVIVEPGRRPLALGTPASSLGPSAYPTGGSIFAFDSSTASGSTCGSAGVTLRAVSLLGGAVTAGSVSATAGRGTVTGLQIRGADVALGPGGTAAVGNWAQLTLGKRVGRVSAPLVLHVLASHGPLPAGTIVAVGFAATAQAAAGPTTKQSGGKSSPSAHHNGTTAGGQQTPAQKTKKHKPKKPVPQPLTVTPPLGFRPSHYVFPVDGGASYVDTYGANRSDIYDGWHHGDDLFAPLGTPIVAVANGKLSLVGWNRLGGWRLWLTDGDGNSFYYAHLAGYSRWILDHPNVRAGQVVGFLGRTGDAFTTAPHLHFEIHPQQLLDLGYDGAVDPTLYLQKWQVVHVPANEIPQPAKLKAPVGTPAEEASVVWRELLIARDLLPRAPAPVVLGGVPRRPFPDVGPGRGLIRSPAAAPVAPVAVVRTAQIHLMSIDRAWPGAVGLGVFLALSTGLFFVVRRRRRTPGEA